jgi:DNA replication protein DnaC
MVSPTPPTSSSSAPSSRRSATASSSTWCSRTRSACSRAAANASRLKLSALPNHKTLDDFDASFQPELDPKRLGELRTLRFLERRVSLLIFGPPGVGKSHLAVGLAMEALRRGHLVRYTTTTWCARCARPTCSAS